MTRLEFEIREHAFEALPLFGKAHPLTRLAGDELREAGFPLFEHVHEPPPPSSSSYMDRSRISSLLSSLNPDLPALLSDACCVIAGQQPGLLTGPIYTFLKAVGTIALARTLSDSWNKPVYPLFWVASEDHDVLEVNRVHLHNKRFVYPFAGELRRGRVPQVADIPIHAAKDELLAFLDDVLPKTEFTPWIMDAVASADYSSYDTAFKSLMRFIFKGTGLRLVDPHALRSLTGPVLADLVRRWPEVREAFEEGKSILRRAGVAPPLESPGLFEIIDGKRAPLGFTKDTVLLSGGDASFDEAAREIRAKPHSFSPGAALRPMLQDAVLPVSVTIAGPTELFYLWQIRPLYHIAGIRPPLLLPRPSATFVEEKTVKSARKTGLEGERIFDVLHAIKNHASLVEPDPETARIKEKAGAFISELEKVYSGDEPRWLARSKRALSAQTEKLVRRLGKERLDAAGRGRSALEKVASAIYPDGKPQERRANVFWFLNLHGTDFARLAIEKLDPLSSKHQAAYMKPNNLKETERE